MQVGGQGRGVGQQDWGQGWETGREGQLRVGSNS